MGKGSNIDKLYEIAVKASDNWIEIAEKLEQDQTWLDKSAKIALSVLSALKDLKMSKQELADKMGVKAQYISRIVKGTENLTLETISKLEKALGKDLMSIPDSLDHSYIMLFHDQGHKYIVLQTKIEHN